MVQRVDIECFEDTRSDALTSNSGPIEYATIVPEYAPTALAIGYGIGYLIDKGYHDSIEESLMGPKEAQQCSFDPQLEMGSHALSKRQHCLNNCDLAGLGYPDQAYKSFCSKKLKSAEQRKICESKMTRAGTGDEGRIQECRGWCNNEFPRAEITIH